MEPCKGKGGIKSITVFNMSDIAEFKTEGDTVTNFRIKRKYGKFTRPVIKLEVPKAK